MNDYSGKDNAISSETNTKHLLRKNDEVTTAFLFHSQDISTNFSIVV